VLLTVLAACQDRAIVTEPAADSPAFSAANAQDDVYIVVLRSNVADVDREADRLVHDANGDLGYVYRHALKGFTARMSDQAAAALRNDRDVLFMEKDGPVSVGATQTNATWGLDRVDQRNLPLSTTYTYNRTGAGVNVYVIDTGIRNSHVDFGGRASGVFTVINDGRGTDDCAGHGTHVAGTIGGATWGIAKSTRLYAVRVLDCAGSGTFAGVIAGVDWVTANAVKPAVANMSLGGGASSTVDAAVSNSIASGVVYSISAGNSNSNACNQSPARTPAAITVGATTSSDARSSFSNFGTCVDIFAPGSSITSAYHTSNTATAVLSGTSMSAPHVAGAAALYLEANPTATPAAVATALTNNATQNVVTNPGTGSPNRLLYTGFIGGGGGTPPAIQLIAFSGNNQTDSINKTLPTRIIVRVIDTNTGAAIGQAPITWTVKTGGGIVNGQAATGEAGFASAWWTLGPSVGTQTVEASTPGATAVTFTATALGAPPPPPPPPPPGPTIVIQIQGGNNQSGPAGSQLPGRLVVRVVDGSGNAVPNITVTFTPDPGHGTVTRPTALSGEAGYAWTNWILGPGTGPQRLTASAPGATSVVFTATAN
jgi:subtilisin family serine protease